MVTTDFPLVERAKAGDKQAEYQLFKQYKHLILREYSYLQFKVPRCFIRREDYLQDSYETFIKALNYVKLEKITNPHSWKFYQSFLFYLQSKNYVIIRGVSSGRNREAYEVPMSHIRGNSEEDDGDGLSPDVSHIPDNVSLHVEDRYHQSSHVTEFLTMLNPVEQKIVKAYSEVRVSFEKTSLRKIGTHVGLSGERIRQLNKLISKKWLETQQH